MCGYNNGISIGLIENEDIEYIESEVRNGNATKSLASTEEQTFLEGCTKDKKNFQFTMGHRKFLMSIVNFLKTYSADHGLNSFICEQSGKRSKCKRKVASVTTAGSNKKAKFFVSQSANEITEVPVRDCLSIERNNLLAKALTSLITYSPNMYVKACVTVNIDNS